MMTLGLADGLQPEMLAVASLTVVLASALLLFARHYWAPSSAQVTPPAPPADTNEASSGGARVSTDANGAPKKSMLVLYGTQTGTAERFAKQIASEATSRYGDAARVKAVDVEDWDFKEELPKADLLLLMFATYGDGEPTDSAGDFIEWMKDQEADKEPLEGKVFGVFGLGNSQYEHFNAIGKLLNKLLPKLGAERIVPLGLGDDDECIEEDLEKWSSGLWKSLDSKLGSHGASAPGAGAGSPAAYDAKVLPSGSPVASPALPHNTAAVPVAEVRELHSGSSVRSCVHVELDLEGTGLSYVAGDHVGVHPQNPRGSVERMAKMLGTPVDAVVELSVPEGPAGDMLSHPPHTPATLRDLLSDYADILGPVSRGSLLALASCAKDPKQEARLRFLASPAGKADFNSWVVAAQRSLLCVMQEFPSARPGLGLFFGSVAQRLQPRYYSISSAPTSHRLAITCAVVNEKTPPGRVLKGVASNWLAAFEASSRLPAHVRTSTFKLPRRADTPIIMVGPGTGLAPFRGFLQAREALRAAGKTLGEALLFFGCREEDKDYIYKEELAGFVESGVVTELHVAFSRKDPSKKDYVQHHVLANARRVWALLREGAYLYVCGDAKHMAKDVHQALIEAAMAAEGLGKDAAAAEVHVLSEGGRYLRDVW